MRIFLLVSFIAVALSSTKLKGQSLPSGTAGIVYTYDAAGDRIDRKYVVNNTTSEIANIAKSDTAAIAKKLNEQVLKVDVLYPNPTTGKFTIRLVKPLQNGMVQIIDLAGHIVVNGSASGSILTYDLSPVAAGLYFLHIQQGEQEITMKIIKR